MTYNSNKYFCYAPFVHFYLDDNGPGLCCQADYTHAECDQKGNDLVVGDLINDVWEGEYWQKVRQDMLNNVPVKSCEACYHIDRTGGVSDRMNFQRRFENRDVELDKVKFPVGLDIRFSNLCNLKCRMCTTGKSSQLLKEVEDNPILQQYGTMNHYDPGGLPISKRNFEQLLNSIDTIEYIQLAGGEPSIMPEVESILQECIKKDRHCGVNSIVISITTNCTNQNPKFKQLLEQFDRVFIIASFEGIGLVNSYIRFPSNFNVLERHFLSYVKQFECMINATIQAYNLPYLKEFTDWIGYINKNVGRFKLNFRLIEEPIHFCCNYLSKPLRDYYIDTYLKNIDFEVKWLVNSGLKEELIRLREDMSEPLNYEFSLHTKVFDTVRKHHIKDYLPEVYEDIKETYDAISV